MADVRRLAIEDTDAIIRAFCDNLQGAAENPLGRGFDNGGEERDGQKGGGTSHGAGEAET